MLAGTALLAAEVTITGTISEEGIVADDGQVYAVAKNDKGEELMELVNKKVQVTGTVEEAEGKKVITITDFEVIE
jgi:outer membrane usher protein FimD/PapC